MSFVHNKDHHGSRVSDFGLQFSGLASRIRGSGFGFWIWGLEFRNSVLGFRVSGFGFRVSGFGFRVLGFGFRVSCFEVRVSGLEF